MHILNTWLDSYTVLTYRILNISGFIWTYESKCHSHLINSIFIPTEVIMVLTKPRKMNCCEGSNSRAPMQDSKELCWQTHESAHTPKICKIGAQCEIPYSEGKRKGQWTRGLAHPAKEGRKHPSHSSTRGRPQADRAAGNQKAQDGRALRRTRPSPYPRGTGVQFPDSPSPWGWFYTVSHFIRLSFPDQLSHSFKIHSHPSQWEKTGNLTCGRWVPKLKGL